MPQEKIHANEETCSNISNHQNITDKHEKNEKDSPISSVLKHRDNFFLAFELLDVEKTGGYNLNIIEVIAAVEDRHDEKDDS